MIVKLDPASADHLLWKVSVPRDGAEVAVDYTRIAREERSYLGEGGYFEAEPDADGWQILQPAAQTSTTTG